MHLAPGANTHYYLPPLSSGGSRRPPAFADATSAEVYEKGVHGGHCLTSHKVQTHGTGTHPQTLDGASCHSTNAGQPTKRQRMTRRLTGHPR